MFAVAPCTIGLLDPALESRSSILKLSAMELEDELARGLLRDL